MAVEKWSDSVVVVRLGDDPQFTEDLAGLPPGFDAVLDFGAVNFINSSNIARLLKLRTQYQRSGGRLLLCNISTQVWGVFLITGLDKLFDFSDNVTTALATLQMA